METPRSREDRYADLLAKAGRRGEVPDLDTMTLLRQELKELNEEVPMSIAGGERRYELSKLQKQADSKLAAAAHRAELAHNIAVSRRKREAHAAEHLTMLGTPRPDRRRQR
ncbi:hypothetical protein [Nocardia gipuzkoensis]